MHGFFRRLADVPDGWRKRKASSPSRSSSSDTDLIGEVRSLVVVFVAAFDGHLDGRYARLFAPRWKPDAASLDHDKEPVDVPGSGKFVMREPLVGIEAEPGVKQSDHPRHILNYQTNLAQPHDILDAKRLRGLCWQIMMGNEFHQVASGIMKVQGVRIPDVDEEDILLLARQERHSMKQPCSGLNPRIPWDREG